MRPLRLSLTALAVLVALTACGSPDGAVRDTGRIDPAGPVERSEDAPAGTSPDEQGSDERGSDEQGPADDEPAEEGTHDGPVRAPGRGSGEVIAPVTLRGAPDAVEPLAGGIDVTQVPVGPGDRFVRDVEGQDGAMSTAFVFLAAWSTAITSGDATELRALSSEACDFCSSVADTASTASPADGAHFTIWPLGDVPPTADYPYALVSVGVETARSRTADGLLDRRSHERFVADLALEQADDGWRVHGVATRPWEGPDR